MIALQEHPAGLILPVRAQPGARKEGVTGERNGALKLAVRAPADEGRANKAIIELLREILHVKRTQCDLLTGAKSRDKRFLVTGVTRAELEQRLARALMSV